MKYCYKLLNEINFEPHSLSPCCNTQGIRIPAMSYEGGPVDLETYSKYIASVLEEINSGGDICRGCREQTDADSWPGASGKFSAISINMHRHYCNCKCVYCNLWKKEDKAKFYEVLPGLKSLQAQNAVSANAWISWGGGEPTILPEFDRASRWILECGNLQHVHSNGLRFSPTVADFLANDRGKLNISLDSGSSEVYKAVKGVDRFSDVVRNLAQYSANGAKNIELKYIIFEKNNNIPEIRQFMELAHNMGIKDIQVSFDFRDQNKGKVSRKSLTAAAFMFVLASGYDMTVTPFYMDTELLDGIKDIISKLQ